MSVTFRRTKREGKVKAMSELQKEYFSFVEKEHLLISKLAKLEKNNPAITNYDERKSELESELKEATKRKTELRIHLDEYERKLASQKTEQLFTENLALIRLQSQYETIPVDKNLDIEITYYPCKHKEPMKIYDLIPVEEGDNHHQVLYTKWELFFRDGGELSGRLNCKHCRKEKEGLRAKFGMWNDKPIGRADFKLRLLR